MQAIALLCEIGWQQRDIILVGEIERRLKTGGQVEQAPPPRFNLPRERPARHRLRRAALQLGFCVQQIGEALGFGQIDPAVGKGAASELAGISAAQAGHCLQNLFQPADDSPAAVEMEFGDIFPRNCSRTRQPQHQCAVNHFAIGVDQIASAGAAGLRQMARKNPHHIASVRPAYAHHGYRGGRRAA